MEVARLRGDTLEPDVQQGHGRHLGLDPSNQLNANGKRQMIDISRCVYLNQRSPGLDLPDLI
jgi:hypothetical protein